jgi:hypothetical protein
MICERISSLTFILSHLRKLDGRYKQKELDEIATAEGEANTFAGAFKTVDARLVLCPQTPFLHSPYRW